MRKIAGVLIAVSTVVPAGGAVGQVNKCSVGGRTVYQDAPCPGAGTRIGPGALAYQPIPGEPGKALCEREAPATFKDPDSVKITGIEGSGIHDTQYLGRYVRARTYTMFINAKNSYGGYTGERIYYCFLSPDEKTFYRVSASAQ